MRWLVEDRAIIEISPVKLFPCDKLTINGIGAMIRPVFKCYGMKPSMSIRTASASTNNMPLASTVDYGGILAAGD